MPALTHLFLRRYEGRYGRSGEGGYGGDYGDYDAEGGSRAGQVRSKYRSRFRRDAQDAAEPEPDTGRNVRFQEQQNREPRVLDTEDVSKGEYQGGLCGRLAGRASSPSCGVASWKAARGEGRGGASSGGCIGPMPRSPRRPAKPRQVSPVQDGMFAFARSATRLQIAGP